MTFARDTAARLAAAAWLLPAAAGAYTYTLDPATVLPAGGGAPAGRGAVVAVLPFEDRRSDRALWRGAERLDFADFQVGGPAGLPGAWRTPRESADAFLLGTALCGALAVEGLRPTLLAPGATPPPGALRLEGSVDLLRMDRRGADGVFATDFRGQIYRFVLELRVRVLDPTGKALLLEKDFRDEEDYRDPTPGGRRPSETFPQYYPAALAASAAALARDGALRRALGLGDAAAAAAVGAPVWINPHTHKVMDPAWNFDPEDGTPRKDFQLVRPGAAP